MIWGRSTAQPAQRLQEQPSAAARNPLLLFEPRPAGPWQFEVRELAPEWERHIERLQGGHQGIRVRN